MRIARSPLARRIVAFAAAVVIVHMAFYAVPRWWYSRPRVYPEAYEKAVEALNGVVGPEAVERSVFSISRNPVSVPYRGYAMVFWADGLADFLYIGAPGDDSFVIKAEFRYSVRTVTARSLSWEKARSAWATLQYLCRTEPSFSGAVTGQRYLVYDPSGFAYETWSSRKITTSADEPWLRDEPGEASTSLVRASVRQLACSRVMRELYNSGAPQVDRKAFSLAMADIIRKSLGATLQMMFERMSLEYLIEPYASMAGKDALPALREIDNWHIQEADARRLVQWFQWAPILNSYLESRARRIGERQAPDVSGEIWAVTALDGKSKEEEVAALTKAAMSGSTIGWKAQVLLLSRWPEEWRIHLTDNYGSLPVGIRRIVPELESSDRITRLIADDASNSAQWYAASILCKGNERELLARLEKIAIAHLDAVARARGARMATKVDLRGLMQALFDTCKSGSSASEARSLARRLFSRPSPGPWTDWTYEEMLKGVAASDSESATAMLADILNAPETMLNAEYAASFGRGLRVKAVAALRNRDTQAARDALLAYLKGSHTRAEWKVTSAVVDAAGDSGDDRALPILEEMLVRCPAPGPDTDESVPGPSGVSIRTLRRAIVAIHVANAANRVESFASLDTADQRSARQESLAWRFSTNELRTLLADDRCRAARAAIYNALATNIVKENAKQNVRR